MLARLRRMKGLIRLVAGLMTTIWTAPAFAQADAARAAALGEQILASVQAIEDGLLETPRDRWDPQGVVDMVGTDPDALAAWVRDNVGWVAYRGALRGAQGVLMDRVGNALDQALLLSTLLDKAGYETRLAKRTLRGTALDRTWERVAAASPSPSEPPAGASAEQVAEAADLYGIDATAVTQRAEATTASSISMIEQLTSKVGLQAGDLAERVGLGPAPDGGAALLAEQKAMLAEHWWVQVRRDGSWADLDPIVADATARGAAEATFAADGVPAELEQTVTVRIVTEQLKDGRLAESSPLEQRLRARELVGRPIHFLHVPVKWPADWPEVLPDTVQVKLRAALYTQREWLPALVVDGQAVRRASVLATGELDEDPSAGSPFANMSVVMTGALTKATDVLATGGDDTAAVPGIEGDTTATAPHPEGELTAEWIEYVIERPGAPARTIRREVFDLVGPARRASGDLSGFTMSEATRLARATAMLGESWIDVSSARIAPEFVLYLAGQNVLANKPLLDGMAADPFSRQPADYTAVMGEMQPFPGDLYAFDTLRFGSQVADRVYLDGPAIVAQHTTLVRGGGGDFSPLQAIDIVENGVGVRPESAAEAPLVRLVQGVVDTNAEALLAAKGEQPVANTAAMYGQGGDWQVLSADDQSKLAALGLDADLTARIARDLAAGLVAVVPTDPALATTAGWWRIDPRDGTTLGMSPTEQGQAAVEYALVLIIQGIIAAAVCMIQEAGIRVMEKEIRSAGVAHQVIRGTFTRANAVRCAAGGVASILHSSMTAASIGILQARLLRVQQGPGERPGTAKPRGTLPGVGPQGGPEGPKPGGTRPFASDTPKGQPPGQGPQPPPGPKTPRTPTKPGVGDEPKPPTTPRQQRLDDALKSAQQAQDKFYDTANKYGPNPTPTQQAELDRLRGEMDRANKDRLRTYGELNEPQATLNPPTAPEWSPIPQKVVPPGTSGPVDPRAPTQFDKSKDTGPTTGEMTQMPSDLLGPPSSGSVSSAGSPSSGPVGSSADTTMQPRPVVRAPGGAEPLARTLPDIPAGYRDTLVSGPPPGMPAPPSSVAGLNGLVDGLGKLGSSPP